MGYQLEADRGPEMTALGITMTEFGPAGFLPEQVPNAPKYQRHKLQATEDSSPSSCTMPPRTR
jgi:inosose dehydratase